jgi:hypothetical protein
MKALTVAQPWATLIAIGAKRIETRSWTIRHRGPLAIHAARAFPRIARDLARTSPFAEALAAGRAPLLLPRGVVIATCTLVDVLPCTTRNLVPATGSLIAAHAAEHDHEFGDFTPGRFAWLLADVHPLPEPVPARGRLGLWDWTPPAEADGP